MLLPTIYNESHKSYENRGHWLGTTDDQNFLYYLPLCEKLIRELKQDG